MTIQRFEQLEVWQTAHAMVLEIYRITSVFPTTERFGLVTQMRRAAVSVPANIVEGFKRRGSKDKSKFYNYAQGSLEELRYFLILCSDLGYVEGIGDQDRLAASVARMLTALIRVNSK